MTAKSTKSMKSTKKIILFRVFRAFVSFVAWGGLRRAPGDEGIGSGGLRLGACPHVSGTRLAVTLALTALLGARGVGARAARQNRPGPTRVQLNQSLDTVDVHVLHVQGNVYMLVGAGGNISLQVGDQGVLLVDTEFPQLSDKIIAEIRKLSNKPIRYIINTHYHPDHTGGNENIAKVGSTLNVGPGANLQRPTATIIAHENVLNRMSAPAGVQPPTPAGAWPTDTYVSGQKELFFNDEGI